MSLWNCEMRILLLCWSIYGDELSEDVSRLILFCIMIVLCSCCKIFSIEKVSSPRLEQFPEIVIPLPRKLKKRHIKAFAEEMLQIRLSKPASESGGAVKPSPTETVTVACPDHLVLADLPVAKGLGVACAATVTKSIGRRSRRQLGERVHFCVQCDFPIAIYGRLIPCEHAFCLDCARSDSMCYLCDERIQKIQTIKMMEGIFVCAAPHCLKSFLKKSDFEVHIKQIHSDLLHHNKEREANDSEAMSSRKPSASDSTVQAPLGAVFSPTSNSQPIDQLPMQQRPMPFRGQFPIQSSEQHPPQSGFDRPMNPIIAMPPQQFGYSPYPSSDGTQQQFYNAIPQNYPRQWNVPPGSVPLEPPMVSQGTNDGFASVEPQGRGFLPGGGNFPPPPLAPPHLAQIQRVRSFSGDNNPDAPPGFGWQA